MSTATVRTGVDTWVSQAKPTTNYGTAKTLSIQNHPTGAVALLWMKNPAPRGAVVLKATLYLYGRNTAPSAPVTVQRVGGQWYASWANWNNRPATTGSPVAVTKANADGVEWAFDVTAQMQAVTNVGAPTFYGWQISTSAGDSSRRDFYALDQGGTRQPVLEVTWSDAPSKPVTLYPGGGHYVGTPKPVLTFDYTDVSGSVQLAAAQVQITRTSDSTAFTASDAALWDSGTVATTDPQLDLSATSYGGVWWDTPSWWRVRVQDGAGLWSSWSDPTEVNYAPHGNLSIDNPPPGTSSFVSEPTPEIAWTFGGNFRAQVAWRVAVALDSDPTKLLTDTGRRTGTDNSYTLPAGVLAKEDAAYRVTVQIWDDKDRVTTATDHATVWLTRTFAFQEDPTPDPADGLTVTPDPNGRPWATLTWHRATAPDSFTVLRDGINIKVGLDPADCNTDATHYRYVDKDATPGLPHTWGVRAVVNGTSTTGTWLTTTLLAGGAVWLMDTTTDDLVAILDAALTLDLPEMATVYEPVGAEVVTRVIQAQRGPQGSFAGRLAAYAGYSAATFEATMIRYRNRPTAPLRLTVGSPGSTSYRVLVGNIVVAPLNEATGDRTVSFDWWSLDGAP